MKLKIFLSGGINNWMVYAKERLLEDTGNTVLSPHDCESDDPKCFVSANIIKIRQADIVLAYMQHDNPSGCGMSFEVGFAHALGIPVFFVNELKNNPKMYMPAGVSTVFESLDSAINAILDL